MHTAPQRKTPKKIILILICLVVIVASGFTAYALTTNSAQKNKASQPASGDTTPTINTEAPTNDQVQAGSDTKTNTIKENDTPQKNDLKASITYTQVNNQEVRIGTLIETLVSDGTCTLTATKSGEKAVSQGVSIQALSNSSTCKGFSIPLSSFTSKGSWDYTIKIDSNGQSTTLNGNFSL